MNGKQTNAISFNGSPMEFEEGRSVAELLETVGKPEQPFAVAVNMQFVPREEYAAWQLKTGDCIDLVVAMQGG